ncbi:MAG: glycosyltransferase family 4 protein [Coriobacteriia bacterium]|nr:glycosyltransferase family 4 protein [Coriobacteriia bacterium]MCL2536850.1 glycosyltransferase family 4 protein [Coriobacteriia bacterium]
MTTAVKVLFDYRMATWSGIGRYSQGLALALQGRDDVELSLVTMKGDPAPPPALADAPVYPASKHPLTGGGYRELRNAVMASGADILHCTHISTPNLKGLNVPIVTTMHDLTPLIVTDTMPSFAKRAIYTGLNQRATTWSSAIITPSEHTAKDIMKLFPRTRCPITAIPLAADELKGLEPRRPDAMDKLPQAFEGTFLLSFGNTKAHKDLPTLIKAFEKLCEKRDELSLVLVGKEPPGYLHEHSSSRLVGRTMFTGPIDDEELVWLYQRAKAFVFPSLYEGFGLPPLEAMSFGCPVVAADAASLPEVVGDAGVLVSPRDIDGFAAAIEKILTDADYASELEDAGLTRAKDFSWATTAAKTAAVYRSVLEKS